MKKGQRKFKVFFNTDCQKYGVLKFGNLMNDCMATDGNKYVYLINLHILNIVKLL